MRAARSSPAWSPASRRSRRAPAGAGRLLRRGPWRGARLPARSRRPNSRRPAVSARITGQPPRSRWTSITSRVVPAVSDTIADVALRQQVDQRRLAGVGRADDGDAQALAQPLAAPVFEMRAISPRSWVMLVFTSSATPAGRSSSGKSIAASRWASACRPSVRQSSYSRCSAPPSCCTASLRCCSVSDATRSAIASACVRSSLLCSKARRVNSPGSARRQKPSSADRLEHAVHHGAAAMQVQLGHHLAGLAVGRLEPHGQPAIDHLAGERVEHAAHHHAPRLGQRRIARRVAALERLALGQEDQRIGRARAAQANDRQGAGMGARRQRRAERVDRRRLHRASRAWSAPRVRARRVWPAPASACWPVARANTLSAILSYSASGTIRRSTSSVLARNGRARMIASALHLADAVEGHQDIAAGAVEIDRIGRRRRPRLRRGDEQRRASSANDETPEANAWRIIARPLVRGARE